MLNFFLQVMAEEPTKDFCYEEITKNHAPNGCGCCTLSALYYQTEKDCDTKCVEDSSDAQCCSVRCLIKSVLVDSKFNSDSLAAYFDALDGLNVTGAILQCESLGKTGSKVSSIE